MPAKNPAKKAKPNYDVPSLRIGFQILESLSNQPRGRVLTELAAELNCPVSSAFRIVMALEELGLVSRDPETKQIRLTRKLLLIGQRAITETNLVEHALDIMRELRDQVVDTVLIGVREGGEVVVLDQAIGTRMFCFVSKLGYRVPAYCSAPGKAMLAFLPEKERDAVLAATKLVRFNERTITGKEELRRELAKVVQQGYAFDNAEQFEGVYCIGAGLRPRRVSRRRRLDDRADDGFGAQTTFRKSAPPSVLTRTEFQHAWDLTVGASLWKWQSVNHEGIVIMRTTQVIFTVLLLVSLSALAAVAGEDSFTIEPGGPNTVRFDAVSARFVRLAVQGKAGTQPCIDELEVYGPNSDKNLALATAGAKATASSCLEGHAAHAVAHLNDGQYGNARSWIPAESSGWAQIELPQPAMIDRVVFSRDREGHYKDRLPAALEVQVSDDGQTWKTVKQIAIARVVLAEPTYMATNEPITLEFPPCPARHVRLTINKTSGGQPCIDELEIYGPDSDKNLALASAGAKASASSCLEGYAIHRVAHLNDGQGGNDHSWIAADVSGWAQIELPATATVQRVVFARDRKGRHNDRLPRDVEVSVSLDGQHWTLVKKAVALEGLAPGRRAPGESVQRWAQRVVGTLPLEWRDGLQQRVDAARDEQDVLALLRLVEQQRELRAFPARLKLEFNPEALRRTMADLAAAYPDRFPPPGFAEQLAAYEQQLPELEKMFRSGRADEFRQAVDLARPMIAFQRRLLLANPILDFQEILILDRKTSAAREVSDWNSGGAHGMTVNWSCDFRPKNPPIAPWREDQMVALRLEAHRFPASAQGDDRPAFRTIFKAAAGHMIQHPELHFDADRLMFSMADADGAFQVFEVRIDGSGLRQVTRDTGPDVDNGDPCYLPDGRIIFNSTRLFTGVPCEDGESYVSNLCLTNADGSGTRLLTFDQESSWHPSMLNDGRVLYTRYEYANVSHQFARLLFHMNPDGTTQSEYYGSNSYWPNSIFYARAIPNHPTQVVGVVCGHHGPNKTGRLVLFDPALGRHETSGAVQTIPGYGKPVQRIVEDMLYAGDWPKFAHPWPLSDKYFLVAARLAPGTARLRHLPGRHLRHDHRGGARGRPFAAGTDPAGQTPDAAGDSRPRPAGPQGRHGLSGRRASGTGPGGRAARHDQETAGVHLQLRLPAHQPPRLWPPGHARHRRPVGTAVPAGDGSGPRGRLGPVHRAGQHAAHRAAAGRPGAGRATDAELVHGHARRSPFVRGLP